MSKHVLINLDLNGDRITNAALTPLTDGEYTSRYYLLQKLSELHASDIAYTNASWELSTNVDDALNNLADYILNTSGNGIITPEAPLSISNDTTLNVAPGEGYINNSGLHKKVNWIDTDVTINTKGEWYIYLDNNANVLSSTVYPDITNNILIGVAFHDGDKLYSVLHSNRTLSALDNKLQDYVYHLGSFIWDGNGKVMEYNGDPLKIQSGACKVQNGLISKSLNAINSDDVGTNFIAFYSSADDGLVRDYYFDKFSNGQIPLDRYTDRALNNSIEITGNHQFTEGGTTVTTESDLTGSISVGDFIMHGAVSKRQSYMTRVSAINATTITLDQPYNGADAFTNFTGSIYVSKALKPIETGKFVKHMLMRTLDNKLVLFYGEQSYDTLEDADDAGSPIIPSEIAKSWIRVAYIIVQEGQATLSATKDIRPLPFDKALGSGQSNNEIISHGGLTGLNSDDHPQYLLTNGSRNIESVISYNVHPTFTTDTQLVDKKFVDDRIGELNAGGNTTEVQFNLAGKLEGNSNFVFDNDRSSLLIGTLEPLELTVGLNTFIQGRNNFAVGDYATALNDGTNAMGRGAISTGASTMAIGFGSMSQGIYTIAEGDGSFAGGYGDSDTGVHLVAKGMGSFNFSRIDTSYAGNGAEGNYSVILGGMNHSTTTDATNSVVLGGDGITATEADTVYVPNLISLGNIKLSNNVDAVAGNLRFNGVNFSGYNGLTWVNLDTQGQDAAGSEGEIQFNDGSGDFSTSNQFIFNATENALNIGTRTGTIGTNSLVIGTNNIASDLRSVAIGVDLNVSGQNSVAIGSDHVVSSLSSVAIGVNNNISSNYGFSIGYDNIVSGQYGIALGNNSEAKGLITLAGGIGTNGKVIAEGRNSFNFSEVSTSGIYGTKADNSAILGGINHTVEISANRTVILGGSNITATEADMVYVPNLISKGNIRVGDSGASNEGDIRYNSTTKIFEGRNNVAWEALTNNNHDKVISGVNTSDYVLQTDPTSKANAIVCDYLVISDDGNNLRAGTLTIVWNDTNVNYNESSTSNIGDTSEFRFKADIDTGNIRILSILPSTPANTWTVKLSYRYL